MANESLKGRVVWHDLVTREGDKARVFYSELLGWTTKTMDLGMGKYTVLEHKGAAFGGIPPVMPTMPADVPSHWQIVVATDDVDATVKTAAERGGRVIVPPMDMPGVGRMAILADPSGAVFAAFKAAPGQASEPLAHEPGRFCWYENISTDVEKTKAFYTALFGWTWENGPVGGTAYFIAKAGERQVGGLMAKPADVPMAAWLSHLLVADLDEATARATHLGGAVLMGPTAVPNIGRFTVIRDAAGAVVALFQGKM